MKFSGLTIVAPARPSSRATYAPANPPPRMSVPPRAARVATAALSPPSRARAQLLDASAQETALGLLRCQRERALECVDGFVVAAQPAEELAARGVEVVVPVELQLVHDRERSLRALGLGDRDGAVQLDDGLRHE